MKQPRWNWIPLLLAFLLLCSCGSGTQGETQASPTPQADLPPDQSTPAPQPEDGPAIVVHNLANFSSGRAWVEFSYEGESARRLGCVDKAGNLLFSFDADSIRKHVPFENGAAYVRDTEGVLYILNDMGQVLTSSAELPFAGIAAWGDGYFLAYRNQEGYDADGFQFLILDQTGQVVKELNSTDCTLTSWEDFQTIATYEGQNNVTGYCGGGVFQFMKPDRMSFSGSSCAYVFYDVKTDASFELECSYAQTFGQVEDGLCRLRMNGEDVLWDFQTQTSNLTELQALKTLVQSEHKDVAYTCGPMSNGRVVYTFYNSYESHREDPIFSYAYADKTGIYPLEAYREYLSAECSAEMAFDETEDRLLLRFVGGDGNYYLAIIDHTGNTIMEPVKCDSKYSSSFFRCGRFLAGTEGQVTIYDTDGTALFTLQDVGGSSIREYSDGAAIVDDTRAVDLNGAPLFTQIHTAGAQELTLSSG